MAEDRKSLLQAYSLGIVITDKERGSDYIEVVPVEEMSLEDGKLSDQKREYRVTAPDAKGVKKTEVLQGGNHIRAKWLLHGNSNRISAPDVVKNETVEIYRYGDTDKYYWAQCMREPSLRRLEIVHYAYCNIPKGLVPFDRDTSYWTEVDTVNKFIQVHTAKNDGEPFAYDLVINAAKGNVKLYDHVGNAIILDSAEDIIQLTTIAGAVITLEKGNILAVDNAGASASMKEGVVNIVDSTGAGMTLENGVMTLKALQIVKDTPSESNMNSQGGSTTVSMSGDEISMNGAKVDISGSNGVALTGSSITANGEDLSSDMT